MAQPCCLVHHLQCNSNGAAESSAVEEAHQLVVQYLLLMERRCYLRLLLHRSQLHASARTRTQTLLRHHAPKHAPKLNHELNPELNPLTEASRWYTTWHSSAHLTERAAYSSVSNEQRDCSKLKK